MAWLLVEETPRRGEVGAWAALRRSLIFFSEGGEQTVKPIAVLLQKGFVLVKSESVCLLGEDECMQGRERLHPLNVLGETLDNMGVFQRALETAFGGYLCLLGTWATPEPRFPTFIPQGHTDVTSGGRLGLNEM